MGAKRNAYRILVGKPEGRRHLARPRHRWRMMIRWILERDRWVWYGLVELAQERDSGRLL
jgi:hypothetical protein